MPLSFQIRTGAQPRKHSPLVFEISLFRREVYPIDTDTEGEINSIKNTKKKNRTRAFSHDVTTDTIGVPIQ